MKRCPQCQKEYGDEVQFCQECGKKLVKVDACPKCGREIDPAAQFCPYCGHSLKEEVKGKYTQEDIEKLKRERENLIKKKNNMKIAGSILLGVGIFVTVACLIVLIVNSVLFRDTWWCITLIVLSSIGLVLGADALIPVGVILLIVQSAVFTKKISNRERTIQEYGE